MPGNPPDDDPKFLKWWHNILSLRHGMGMPLDPNPVDPDYDYYKLYKSNWTPPPDWGAYSRGEGRGHFPDVDPATGKAIKSDTNPRAVLHGVDTRTGKEVAPENYTGPLTDEIKRNSNKYATIKPKLTKAAGWSEDESKRGDNQMSMQQPQQGQMNPQMLQQLMQMLQQRGGAQGQPQGQPGAASGAPQQQAQGGTQPQAQPQQQPPASIPPQALMTLLTYLAQTGGGIPGQPAPTSAGQLQGPQQMQQLLPMLMQHLGQQGPPPQQMQAQQQQQAAQQQQMQQQQGPQAILQMLSKLGLKIG